MPVQVVVDDPRADPDGPPDGVEGVDVPPVRELDDHAPGHGDGFAVERSPSSAGGQGDPMLPRPEDEGHQVVDVLRPGRRLRPSDEE